MKHSTKSSGSSRRVAKGGVIAKKKRSLAVRMLLSEATQTPFDFATLSAKEKKRYRDYMRRKTLHQRTKASDQAKRPIAAIVEAPKFLALIDHSKVNLPPTSVDALREYSRQKFAELERTLADD